MNLPVYFKDGVPTECSRSIPKITLNGAEAETPSFYAPTNNGNPNMFLGGGEDGVPVWRGLQAAYSRSAMTTGSSYVLLPIAGVYGLLIQWGTAATSGNLSDTLISCKRAFTSVGYSVFCQPSNGSGTTSKSVGGDDNNLVHSKTVSSFKVRNDGGNFSYIDWIAIGWADL